MITRTIVPLKTRAFALPAVLILSTGVLVLLATLMIVVSLERTSSNVSLGAYQAELAVESGLEEAKMLLANTTATDTFAMATIPVAVEFDDNDDGVIEAHEDGELDLDVGERGRPYLFAIQGQAEGDSVSYRWTPLFSANTAPEVQIVGFGGQMTRPISPGVEAGSDGELQRQIALKGTPHLQAPVTAWRTVRGSEGRPVSRYSYWVEDLQGYLDPEFTSGNTKNGRHARANEVWSNRNLWADELQPVLSDYLSGSGQVPLWPAPGLNPNYVEQVPGFSTRANRLLNEVAVYAIDSDPSRAGVVDESSLDDLVEASGKNAITPASLLALKGASLPIQ